MSGEYIGWLIPSGASVCYLAVKYVTLKHFFIIFLKIFKG